MDTDKARQLQANIRREAMRGSVEEAVSACMAIVAEAVLTIPKNDRQKFMHLIGQMLVDYVKQGERSADAKPDTILRIN